MPASQIDRPTLEEVDLRVQLRVLGLTVVAATALQHRYYLYHDGRRIGWVCPSDDTNYAGAWIGCNRWTVVGTFPSAQLAALDLLTQHYQHVVAARQRAARSRPPQTAGAKNADGSPSPVAVLG